MEASLTAMEKNRGSPYFQWKACALISIFAEEVLALPLTTTRAVAKAVLAAVDSTMHDLKLLQFAIPTIQRLCGELNQSIACKALKTVIKAMLTHAQEWAVQSHGCNMLIHFAKSGDENIACMWAEGALSVLVDGISLLLSSR